MNEMHDTTSFHDGSDHVIDENGDKAAQADFLLSEGLDLLAQYRAIENRDVRIQVLALVSALARAARVQPDQP